MSPHPERLPALADLVVAVGANLQPGELGFAFVVPEADRGRSTRATSTTTWSSAGTTSPSPG